MNHYWRLILFKITIISALLLGLRVIIPSPAAFADSCSSPGTGVSVCMITRGAGVTVVQPHLQCYLGGPGPNPLDVLQGCNGSNMEKIGQANFNGVQQWVIRYGWTYSGTGDRLRYFTFINYTYFSPIDTTKWWVPYSDGDDVANNCYQNADGCNYEAWDNYVSDWHSPTAQLRDWVTTSRPDNQANPYLEAPQPFAGNCQGNQAGTKSYQLNVGVSLTNVAGGSIGYQSTDSYTYYKSGQCNDGSGVDTYSTYMNLNWDGGTSCYLNQLVCATSTQQAQSFVNVTAFDGLNGINHNHFGQGWNLLVNWYDNINHNTVNVSLHGNAPTYSLDDWTY